jgi:hypothetical protein
VRLLRSIARLDGSLDAKKLGDVPVEPHFAKGKEATLTSARHAARSPHMEMPQGVRHGGIPDSGRNLATPHQKGLGVRKWSS